jgi:hypothetical protein
LLHAFLAKYGYNYKRCGGYYEETNERTAITQRDRGSPIPALS